jgi:IclR family acetate operon transcriptional repressor
VERAFDVLTTLSAGPLGVTDIATQVGLPKSTVARLLETLGAGGYVEQLPADGRYRLGPGLATLGAAARPGGDLIAIAHPWLVELAATVGEAAGLSVAEGFSVRYIDQVDTHHEVRVRDWTGTRAPMHAVSSGLALLAELSTTQLAAVLPARLEALTGHTVTDPAVLRERLEYVRRAGFAWVRDEFADGISSVAAAVRDGSGVAVAAVHVHGPSFRFPAPGSELRIALQVIACADRISTRQGGRA